MWFRTWILAFVLFVAWAGALEIHWRGAGHFATVVDDDALWAEARSQIDDDPSTVVLIGMSRMQLDFSSEVFHDRFPGRKLVRLEAPTRHPISALASLAADEAFRGTVIASVAMPWLRKDVYDGFDRELAYLKNVYGWNARLNRNAATFLQSHLAILNPILSLREVLPDWLRTGKQPAPNFLRTHSDRSREGHYALRHDLQRFKQLLADISETKHARNHLTPEQLLAELEYSERLAARIRSRGGRVVFVRFPTSGRLWEIDERYYPRADYWDAFAARTQIDTLHFRDVPALAEFECVDGSHLDARDRAAFTGALLDALEARGWLTPP